MRGLSNPFLTRKRSIFKGLLVQNSSNFKSIFDLDKNQVSRTKLILYKCEEKLCKLHIRIILLTAATKLVVGK